MRKFIVRVAVCVLRLINLLFLPFHQKERVVMISRQSDTPTLDICLLSEEFEKHNIKFVILAKTLKKSLTGMISYGFHLLCQMYYLATSKVVIVDGYCILVSILPKRNGQCVIQMWHALGAIKKLLKNTRNSLNTIVLTPDWSLIQRSSDVIGYVDGGSIGLDDGKRR